ELVEEQEEQRGGEIKGPVLPAPPDADEDGQDDKSGGRGSEDRGGHGEHGRRVRGMQPEGGGEEQPQRDSRHAQNGQIEKGNLGRLSVRFGFFHNSLQPDSKVDLTISKVYLSHLTYAIFTPNLRFPLSAGKRGSSWGLRKLSRSRDFSKEKRLRRNRAQPCSRA